MNKIRFTKVRDVKSPCRSNVGDAGIDFYTPVDLTINDLVSANKGVENTIVSTKEYSGFGIIRVILGDNGYIKTIIIGPNSRVIIPSGIKTLIEPIDSGLIAANKSGVSTVKGLVYTAEVVDSNYVGEIHICVANTSPWATDIEMGKKIVQFLHLPVYMTTPEEISVEDYENEAKDWGSRGENWQGSTDNRA